MANCLRANNNVILCFICDPTREMNAKEIVEWAHKQLGMTLHTLVQEVNKNVKGSKHVYEYISELKINDKKMRIHRWIWQKRMGIYTSNTRQMNCQILKKHCLSSCKISHCKNMIRCCFCNHWFHIQCLKLSEDDISGVWSCPGCMTMASDVRTAKDKIDTLTALVRELIKCTIAERDDRGQIISEMKDKKTKNSREEILL